MFHDKENPGTMEFCNLLDFRFHGEDRQGPHPANLSVGPSLPLGERRGVSFDKNVTVGVFSRNVKTISFRMPPICFTIENLSGGKGFVGFKKEKPEKGVRPETGGPESVKQRAYRSQDGRFRQQEHPFPMNRRSRGFVIF